MSEAARVRSLSDHVSFLWESLLVLHSMTTLAFKLRLNPRLFSQLDCGILVSSPSLLVVGDLMQILDLIVCIVWGSSWNGTPLRLKYFILK